MNIFLLGFLTAIGIYIILAKFGLSRIIRFDKGIDVVFTIGILMFLSATFSGAMVGAIAGICLSLFLGVTRIFVKPKPLPKPRLPKINWRRKVSFSD